VIDSMTWGQLLDASTSFLGRRVRRSAGPGQRRRKQREQTISEFFIVRHRPRTIRARLRVARQTNSLQSTTMRTLEVWSKPSASGNPARLRIVRRAAGCLTRNHGRPKRYQRGSERTRPLPLRRCGRRLVSPPIIRDGPYHEGSRNTSGAIITLFDQAQGRISVTAEKVIGRSSSPFSESGQRMWQRRKPTHNGPINHARSEDLGELERIGFPSPLHWPGKSTPTETAPS